MKLLILSDTHGNTKNLFDVIKTENDASLIIHLGDGEKDVLKAKKEFPKKEFIGVKGNCDLGSKLPLICEYQVDGKKILMTHGHIFNVKNEIFPIYLEAKEKQIDILLFGHTHQPITTNENGIYIMNPGSLNERIPSYGIINIDDGKIDMEIIKL